MNLGGLRGTIGRNKGLLGVAGAAIVAALAWRSRSAKASTSAAPDASTGLASYGAGYQTSAATGYDSTASDVYNAVQPQLEQTQEMLRGLRELWENPTPPTPVPADPTPPTPVPAEPSFKWGDERRDTIAGYYDAFLHRGAGLPEINVWDATGASLEAIRAGIVGSQEALGLG